MAENNNNPQTEQCNLHIVSGSSFRKDSYTLAEVKEIARKFTRAATPSKYIQGIDERFEKIWKLNFGG
jgi:hypothetical protein